jgi:CubicO group peptidase (beta-lactamase class C family)
MRTGRGAVQWIKAAMRVQGWRLKSSMNGYFSREVLNCASPLALFGSLGACESARGLAQSKALARRSWPRFASKGWACSLFMVALFHVEPVPAAPARNTFPEAHWESSSPAEAGLSGAKLRELQELVGGRGCVVRYGRMIHSWGDPAKSSDVASAFKPVLSLLLLMAVEEGKLRSVDDRVAEFEPRLRTINPGKDEAITWRHLAMQTSGYGLVEKPGAAYSYNDYAITLYYDTLTWKVFGTNGTEVLRTRFAEPLQFEDAWTHDAFGPRNRPGRLALSPRDFARVGLLVLRQGRWRDKQLLREESVKLATASPLAPGFPRSSGQEAPMLPGQRTMGGGRNITPVGPGYYSFNWWLNQTNALGQRLLEDAPEDAMLASGHGGRRVLFLFPSRDLIVSWNDSVIDDHDQSPGNAGTKMNRAAKLIRGALRD